MTQRDEDADDGVRALDALGQEVPEHEHAHEEERDERHAADHFDVGGAHDPDRGETRPPPEREEDADREGEQDAAHREEDREHEAAPVAPPDATEGDDEQECDEDPGQDEEGNCPLETPRSPPADDIEDRANGNDGEHENEVLERSGEPEEDGDEQDERREATGGDPSRRRLRPSLRDFAAALRADGAGAEAEGGGKHEEGRPDAPELVARERADHEGGEVSLDDLPLGIDEDELPDPVGRPGQEQPEDNGQDGVEDAPEEVLPYPLARREPALRRAFGERQRLERVDLGGHYRRPFRVSLRLARFVTSAIESEMAR